MNERSTYYSLVTLQMQYIIHTPHAWRILRQTETAS